MEVPDPVVSRPDEERSLIQVPDQYAARSEAGLRVVVVSRPDAFNEYVLARLVTVARLEKLLTAVPPTSSHTLSWAHQRLRAAPISGSISFVRRLALPRLEARVDKQVAKQLPKLERSVFATAELISNADLKGDPGRRMLSDISPDLMILSGAPLLRREIYSVPRHGTVNVHWGITPNYRGEQSMFTALRYRDYASIGATLHYLDEGIDTGPVVAQCWPSLDPTDDFASICAKTARLVAKMLTDFVVQLRTGPVSGQRLAGPGLLFRGRDRRVWHHLSYAVQRRILSHRPPSTPGGIVRYW
jgi:folate-dependent phosphoribosylglycinamide formyltransferase PurN